MVCTDPLRYSQGSCSLPGAVTHLNFRMDRTEPLAWGSPSGGEANLPSGLMDGISCGLAKKVPGSKLHGHHLQCSPLPFRKGHPASWLCGQGN